MRAALAIVMATGVLAAASPAFAQSPAHASCQGSSASRVLNQARSAVASKPADLDALFKLADVLTEAECYEEAVHILEEGQEVHPQNAQLATRLRSARSMIGEQRYIEGVTRAEESARLQRNVLRCRQLNDVSACEEALTSRRNDPELLVANGDGLVKQDKPREALASYRRAAEITPANATLQGKIKTLDTQLAARASPQPSDAVPMPGSVVAKRPVVPAPARARVVQIPPVKVPSFSNQEPAARSN